MSEHINKWTKQSKKQYSSWVEAVRFAYLHAKDQKAVVNIYKCKVCNKYHIGRDKTR